VCGERAVGEPFSPLPQLSAIAFARSCEYRYGIQCTRGV
jgi:hypothetical protein